MVTGDFQKVRGWALVMAMVAGVATALSAPPVVVEGQERDSRIRKIKPRSLTFAFERLVVVSEEYGLDIEYVVERDSWKRLQEREIDLWAEVWIPVEVEFRFHAFNYVHVLWPVTMREATLEFPRWIAVDEYDRVGICLLATGPDEALGSGRGWVCESSQWFRPRSNFSVQLSAGATMRLRRQDNPLRLLQLYWRAPYGPFFLPGYGAPFRWDPELLPRVRPRQP